jgi:hydrogenase-4 component F
MLALLGLPPAVIFASELGIARAGATAGLTPAIGATFALAFAAFAALAVRTARMLLGPPVPALAGHADPSANLISGRLSTLDAGPLVAGLVVVAGLGVTTWPLDGLLSAAAAIVVPGSGI